MQLIAAASWRDHVILSVLRRHPSTAPRHAGNNELSKQARN